MNQLSPWASQLVLVIKNSAVNAGDIRNMGPIPVSGGSLGRKRAWQPTPIFLPEKFHRQRSLVGDNNYTVTIDINLNCPGNTGTFIQST